MERRRDPYDGKTQTLQEMVKKYQGTYSKSEVESYFEFECTAVTAVASVPASAPALKAASNEIEGLRHWLKEKGRESQFDQVSSWCEENGAVLLEEARILGCLGWQHLATQMVYCNRSVKTTWVCKDIRIFESYSHSIIDKRFDRKWPYMAI